MARHRSPAMVVRGGGSGYRYGYVTHKPWKLLDRGATLLDLESGQLLEPFAVFV